MTNFEHIARPAFGEPISNSSAGLPVPDQPIIPLAWGDGTWPGLWRATGRVLDWEVKMDYVGRRRFAWMELCAGDKANRVYGPDSWLPEETLSAVREYLIAIKGPLTTPIGGGIRSINVALRQKLDLYVCLRPVKWYQGVPSPGKHPRGVERVKLRGKTGAV